MSLFFFFENSINISDQDKKLEAPIGQKNPWSRFLAENCGFSIVARVQGLKMVSLNKTKAIFPKN